MKWFRKIKKINNLTYKIIYLIYFVLLGIIWYEYILSQNLTFSNNFSKNYFNHSSLTIFIGLIAYIIPFLWNAYKRLLDKKDKARGEKVENILAKVFYQKGIKYFGFFIQAPMGISIFVGLFILAFLPHYLKSRILLTFFLYFFFLPQLYEKIESRSDTDLKKFLEETDPSSEDTEKIFRELWQRSDEEIEKEFSIKASNILKYFAKKLEELISDDNLSQVLKLIRDFDKSLEKRYIYFLVNDFFEKTLQWHFKIWQKKYECKEANKVLRTLEFIIRKIEERALREDEINLLFDRLKKHISSYSKEKIIKDERVKCYIEDLFRIFYSIFFKVMEDIKDFSKRDEIWDSFPDEWKITKDNYKRYLESRISWNRFIKWAWPRIQYSEKDYDEFLDEVIKNLFPEVDLITWGRILLFRYSPYGPEGKIKYVLEKKWHFGHVGGGTGVGGGNIEKWLSDKIKESKESTYELALFLFKNTFTKENLEKYIKELKDLESTYDKNSLEEKHRLSLLNIFTAMLDYYNKQKNE